MARSSGMSQALARSPGLAVSTVLTCVVGALLAPLAGLALFVGGLALTVVLCAGGLERPAVRLLGRARAFSETEAAALAPAMTLLCQKGLGPPVVDLYARDREVGIGAGAAGRRSVVVSAGLLQAAQLGELPADQAAGVIAGAVGRIRLGQTRFDVAVEFWTVPWQLVHAVCLAIAKPVGLFPLTQFAWQIRFVMATVAVAQSVADGRIAAGLVVSIFIALTYLAPQWRRRWDIRSQDDSDRFVTENELGDALGRFLCRCPPEPRTLERINRLIGPVLRRSPALVISDPTPRVRDDPRAPSGTEWPGVDEQESCDAPPHPSPKAGKWPAGSPGIPNNGVMSNPSRPVLQVLPQFRGTASVGQSTEQRRRLIEFVAAGYQRGRSLRELAEQTGRTQTGVRRALDEAGVARRGRGAQSVKST